LCRITYSGKSKYGKVTVLSMPWTLLVTQHK
jgi:hypothetical protein